MCVRACVMYVHDVFILILFTLGVSLIRPSHDAVCYCSEVYILLVRYSKRCSHM